MNIKTYFIILLFFNYCSVRSMEAVDVPEKINDGDYKKAGISLPIPAARTLVASLTKEDRDTPKVTPRDKTTPRDFEELSELVKSQKTLPNRIKKTQNSQSVIIESGDDQHDDTTVMRAKTVHINELINSLADGIHLEPKVMAEAVLRVHGEGDKKPLNLEEKGYEELLKKDEEKYQALTKEIFLRMLLKELREEDLSAPPLVDAHFGILRSALKDKNKSKDCCMFLLGIWGGVVTLIAAGLTVWAAVVQAHSAASGGNSTGVGNSTGA